MALALGVGFNATVGARSVKLSIITVCYNSVQTIAHCLASVADQSFSQIEHIVIDGASTDGTAALVRDKGHHVVQLVSEPDHGIYDAMNKGLALATGDIIGILNADDRYADKKVLTRVATQMARQNLDILYGDVAFFQPDDPSKLVRRFSSARFNPGRIGWGWMPAHPALFVRREVFERVGPYRTDYKIAGDYEWVARAFSAGPMRHAYLPEVLVHMQMGGVSTRNWRSTVLLNQEVIRACRTNGISTNWFKILSKYPMKAMEWIRP